MNLLRTSTSLLVSSIWLKNISRHHLTSSFTEFICDELTNSCGADQNAKDTCQEARAAASAATKGTGGQADAFNAVFGIETVCYPRARFLLLNLALIILPTEF